MVRVTVRFPPWHTRERSHVAGALRARRRASGLVKSEGRRGNGISRPGLKGVSSGRRPGPGLVPGRSQRGLVGAGGPPGGRRARSGKEPRLVPGRRRHLAAAAARTWCPKRRRRVPVWRDQRRGVPRAPTKHSPEGLCVPCGRLQVPEEGGDSASAMEVLRRLGEPDSGRDSQAWLSADVCRKKAFPLSWPASRFSRRDSLCRDARASRGAPA